MIYTLTTNPSLDYYINLAGDIVYGGKNRSTIETFDAGGKGVNVSIFLDELNVNSTALGFLGGFTKDIYLSILNKYHNLIPSFTNIKENTRINITNLSDNTSFNVKGPNISDDEFNKLYSRLNNLYSGDFLVISGNIQDEIIDNMDRLIASLDLNDIKLVIDGEKVFLDTCKLDNVFIVKMNEKYDTYEDIKKAAFELLERNVRHVIYEDRLQKEVYYFSNDSIYKYIENDKESNVHYTDAFVASTVYSYYRGASDYEAFNFACAACKHLTFSGSNPDILKDIYKTQDSIKDDIIKC